MRAHHEAVAHRDRGIPAETIWEDISCSLLDNRYRPASSGAAAAASGRARKRVREFADGPAPGARASRAGSEADGARKQTARVFVLEYGDADCLVVGWRGRASCGSGTL